MLTLRTLLRHSMLLNLQLLALASSQRKIHCEVDEEEKHLPHAVGLRLGRLSSKSLVNLG